MPADGIPPFAISGDVGTSRPEEQLLIETIRSNTHPKDLIWACAEQAIRPTSATAMSVLGVRRDKAALSSGCKPHPANAPAGSNRSSYGGNEVAEAFGKRVTNW